MRELNLTGGQDHMKSFVVETTPSAVERLNVFRATPFEYDTTGQAITATAVIGAPAVVSGGVTPGAPQRIENSLTGTASTRQR